MPDASDVLSRCVGIGRIALVPVLAAVTVFAQAPPSPSAPAQGPAATKMAAPASNASQPACPHSPDMDIPLNQTIQAQVTGTLDSGHLKVGKGIWVNVVNGVVYPGCTLEKGAAIYGRITEAASAKTSDRSVLSILFDRADCSEHGKKALSMQLIGLVGPPEDSEHGHDAMPSEVSGIGRQISQTVASTDGFDADLNPHGARRTLRPGAVMRMPSVTLEPEGGPECSARISSKGRSVQLGTGAQLILIMQGAK